jgi:AAA15 family ATPase/GTPase
MNVAENTSRKTLYISRASQMDRDIAKNIFCFFKENFISIIPFFENPDTLLSKFDRNKKYLIKALQNADIDIVDISVKKTSPVPKPININIVSEDESIEYSLDNSLNFTTYHKHSKTIPFNFLEEESRGTQILFFAMLSIIDIIRDGKILLVDELENSLHIKIIEYILQLFHNSSSAQIIYTTHNTHLLNLNNLRKDQIYFVNKKDDGSSDLYSLFDYKDFRDTMDLRKAYLEGRFDAIPYINDYSPLFDNEK